MLWLLPFWLSGSLLLFIHSFMNSGEMPVMSVCLWKDGWLRTAPVRLIANRKCVFECVCVFQLLVCCCQHNTQLFLVNRQINGERVVAIVFSLGDLQFSRHFFVYTSEKLLNTDSRAHTLIGNCCSLMMMMLLSLSVLYLPKPFLEHPFDLLYLYFVLLHFCHLMRRSKIKD